MVENLKIEIAHVFDDVAPRYDSNQFFEMSAQKLIGLFDHDAIEKVLDVATGTGTIALLAAERYPRAEIKALDISSGMLDQARNKALERDIKNIDFRQKDIERISIPKMKYDIITCGYALFFLPNMERTISKLYKCLNISGQFIFSSFTQKAFSPYRDMFRNLINDYGITLPEQIGIMLQTPREIKKLCQILNIENYRIKSSKIRYMIGFEDWWSLLNSAGYKGLLNQVGEQRMAEFKNQHKIQILEYSKSDEMLLIADSIYTIIKKY